MGFTSTIVSNPKSVGFMRMSMGTWDMGSANGGDIDTGLVKCHFINLTPYAASAKQVAAVETFPCDGSAVTIANNNEDIDGVWQAWGY